MPTLVINKLAGLLGATGLFSAEQMTELLATRRRLLGDPAFARPCRNPPDAENPATI